jgi:tripartite-type tricarboxylate transporter receptor subunit TctC
MQAGAGAIVTKFLRRRQFLLLAAGALALPAVSRVARAQAYPSRPVRLIAPFPPGGVTDLFARLIAQTLSERLGQPFIVENRPGSGGNLGTEAVVRSAPDGYTLLLIGSNNSWNATLYDSLKFDFIRDIAPVASIHRAMNILVAHPSFPARTVPELLGYAKANPRKISMASGGVGSAAHLYGELFKWMAGIDMLHVAYRGAGPAMTDLIGGQVHVMFDNMATSTEHVRAGRLRALAVTGPTRSEALPHLPTVGEFVPGYEASAWQGIGVPQNTPSEIVDKLNKEIVTALAEPRMKARFAELGVAAFALSPADLRQLVAKETEKWSRLIRAANLKAE